MPLFKRLTLSIFIFALCALTNIVIVRKIYAQTKKENHITIILDELEKISVDAIPESEIAEEMKGDTVTKDKRVAILKAFFRRHESPLYEHAEYIVKISDENGLDYRLIPAISMQESGACRVIPPESHNCWGWGIYGNLITRFPSYPEAIGAVARGLKTHYLDKGLTTPEEIMRKYNPSSNGSWAFGVNTFIDVLQ